MRFGKHDYCSTCKVPICDDTSGRQNNYNYTTLDDKEKAKEARHQPKQLTPNWVHNSPQTETHNLILTSPADVAVRCCSASCWRQPLPTSWPSCSAAQLQEEQVVPFLQLLASRGCYRKRAVKRVALLVASWSSAFGEFDHLLQKETQLLIEEWHWRSLQEVVTSSTAL